MNLRLLCLLCFCAALHTAQAFDTVVIDAGHGGSDPGAVRGRLYEKTLCLDVAQRLESLLKAKGLHTVMTRRTDKTVSLDERARVANRYPGAVFVSVHFNASRDRSARGMETHYLSAKGKRLATAIQDMLDSRVVGKDRGIKEEDFKVLRATKGTAVLVECGFISNAADAANCGSWKHRANVAQSIAAGLLSLRSKL